jgi:hypothetical protein
VYLSCLGSDFGMRLRSTAEEAGAPQPRLDRRLGLPHPFALDCEPFAEGGAAAGGRVVLFGRSEAAHRVRGYGVDGFVLRLRASVNVVMSIGARTFQIGVASSTVW